MSGLKDDYNVVHVISDLPPVTHDRLYALCDIVRCAQIKRSSGSFTYPMRNWAHNEVTDAVPTCISCIGAVREAITPP